VSEAERIDTLEFKLAHLERAQQELSDVLVRQQRELDRLNARLERLQHLMEALQEPAAPQDEFEVPPHY
jgi:SlyX protein